MGHKGGFRSNRRRHRPVRDEETCVPATWTCPCCGYSVDLDLTVGEFVRMNASLYGCTSCGWQAHGAAFLGGRTNARAEA